MLSRDRYRTARLQAAYALEGTAVLVTAPTDEPISLEEAKGHLRVTGDDDDALIQGYITAARQWVEARTTRALMTQTWDYVLDEFPWSDAPIVLPKPTLISVTSVTSYDTANAATVFSAANYLVDTSSEPGRIVLNDGVTWPAEGLRTANACIVRVVAGYGASGQSVPGPIRSALLLLVEQLYDKHQDHEAAVEMLLAPYTFRRC